MSFPKNYLIALLVLTTVGGALLVWRQYAELTELRAAAMDQDERAGLQKRLWDLEKLNRELREQLARRTPGSEGDRGAAFAEGERAPRDPGGRGGRGDPRREGFGPQFTAMRDLMAKPEVQAMLNLQQQSALDGRYAALFRNLNLPAEQIERLKALLSERSLSVMDVMAAARDQGIDPRENPQAFRKLVADAQNEINNSIKSVIGEAGFAQLTNYEQTMAQRSVVGQLEQRLSYTNTPLTSGQVEQLVEILASNPAPRAAANPPPPDGARGSRGGPADFGGGPPPGRGGPELGGMVMATLGPGAAPMVEMLERSAGRGGATITPAAVSQAQTVLSPPQLQALQQIQQQQQSQQQLRQMVNETLGANPPPSPGGTGAGAGNGTPKGPPPVRQRPGG